MLIRLLYASRSTNVVTKDMLDSILSKSRAHNPGAGITGILCHSGNMFLQVLEGNRREVSNLYNRIAGDSRHKDVEILHYEEVTERRYSNWTMGQVNLDKVNPSTLLKYSEKPELNPYVVAGKMSIALLDELIASAAIVSRG
jgi:hypothetical protein